MLILLPLALLGCSDGGTGSTGAPPSGPVNIGLVRPSSGPDAAIGKSVENATRLAVDEYNASRGDGLPKINLVVRDELNDEKKAQAMVASLIEQDEVYGIVGPCSGVVSTAVSRIGNRNRIVLINPTARERGVAIGGDYTFRMSVGEFVLGQLVVDVLAAKRPDIKKVALLQAATDRGDVFQQGFEAGENSIAEVKAYESFKPGASDFRAALKKLVSSKPDAIVVFFESPADLKKILEQRAELGIKIPVVTSPDLGDAGVLEAVGPIAEGAMYGFAGDFDLKVKGQSAPAFFEEYRKKYGEDPDYNAGLGYDAAKLLLLGLQANGFDKHSMSYSVQDHPAFDSATGYLSYEHARNRPMKTPGLRVIRGGKPVSL